ncbi:MAG: hypothetical protein IPO88_20260 [Nannocystis sp.]|uniref:hypothetical protein n=1 Tax=Nannocystis sp. TaxID=1962667 RepID=UPI0024230BFD|nr:hypothetical protein [Nannocystis sp.]MBK9755795.1 hypothetical protein [Nannocystis sp.]
MGEALRHAVDREVDLGRVGIEPGLDLGARAVGLRQVLDARGQQQRPQRRPIQLLVERILAADHGVIGRSSRHAPQVDRAAPQVLHPVVELGEVVGELVVG